MNMIEQLWLAIGNIGYRRQLERDLEATSADLLKIVREHAPTPLNIAIATLPSRALQLRAARIVWLYQDENEDEIGGDILCIHVEEEILKFVIRKGTWTITHTEEIGYRGLKTTIKERSDSGMIFPSRTCLDRSFHKSAAILRYKKRPIEPTSPNE